MSDRREFSKKVRLQAWDRAGGRCEECGRKLFPGDEEYDHDRTAYHGGDSSLENCRVVCTGCHALKTKDHNSNASVISIPKSRRLRAKNAGIKDKRGGFRKPPPGYRYDWGSGRYVRS